jgi:hypothetical protein
VKFSNGTTAPGASSGPRSFLRFLPALLLLAGLCPASTNNSFTGTLTSPDTDPGDIAFFTVSIAVPENIALQTYGFGGGVNGAGNTISAGGFDPFVGLFEGTGATALFLDGTADNLSNYMSEPSACPPAGLVTIGSVSGQCGDVNLEFTGLAAGTYTVLLSDADLVPSAVYETVGYLGDGFSDLTGGALPFQTCYDLSDCNTDTPQFAIDIATSGDAVVTAPEPGTYGMVLLGLVAAASIKKYRSWE